MRATLRGSRTSFGTTRSLLARCIGAIVALCILSAAGCGSAFAVDLQPNPSDCPKNKDGSAKYRCLTIDEYAAMTEEYVTLKGRLEQLEFQKRHFGHVFKPWFTLGGEYLPNDHTYHPYGMAGIDIGRVSVWGGFFGDTPAAGVGWKF